jgi:NTE family protein
MSFTRAALALCAFAILIPQPAAAQAPAAAPAVKRPRVALVLSGGGARGFAHIGVLRVLQEMRVPVDYVVGTSMGSVVGGAYAAGATLQELEATARNTDWDRVVADRPARDDLAFRRREEDLLLPSRIEFGVSSKGASLPPAAAGNAALEAALDKLLPPGTRNTPVSRLPLPFRSVASDLVTGELVDLVDTPLFMTMRASLAVPGVFAPIRINQRLVVDGGLVRNLPVDLARAMGADVVIAVNVGTPLAPEKELTSAVGVAQQMINILTEQNVQRSLQELKPHDILVSPDLAGVTFLDFARYESAIRAGEEATRALAARLAPLAIGADEYAALEQRRVSTPVQGDSALRLARLEVHASGSINPKALAVQTGLKEGEAVTREDVRQAARTLYGRGDLARVETEVTDKGQERSVVVRTTEAPWASNRVRVGLELASDFDDDNTYAIKLMHVKSNLNPLGAELRTVARIGTHREFGMQWWQPLAPGSQWYAASSLSTASAWGDVFHEGRRTSRVDYNVRSVNLVLGRGLGDWGDVQLGVARYSADVRPAIPEDPSFETLRIFDTTQFVRYRLDTLDSPGFPTRGTLIDAQLEHSRSSEGSEGLAQSEVVALSAFQLDKWAGHVYGEWARAQEGTAPRMLGGFMRLSGTPVGSVEARSTALARLVMARKFASLPFTLGGAVRGGFSLEVGGGYDHGDPEQKRKFKQAGSAFLSVDTRFGPAYFAAGATRGGDATLYLFLGPIW